jgi:hypothetical protein
MTPPTATPRTDAAWAASFSPDRANFSVRDECEKLETELAAAREKVRVLREALENLRDEQNGAPLCTRETEWKAAMDRADAALAATKEGA